MHALSRRGTRAAIDTLIREASRHPDVEVRKQFVLSAQGVGDRAVTEALLGMMRSDAAPGVRAMAAHALGRRDRDDPRLTEALIRCSREERDSGVARAALSSLGYRREEAAWRTLVDVIRSEAPAELRIQSAQALQHQADSRHAEAILRGVEGSRSATGDPALAASLDETLLHLKRQLDVPDLHNAR